MLWKPAASISSTRSSMTVSLSYSERSGAACVVRSPLLFVVSATVSRESVSAGGGAVEPLDLPAAVERVVEEAAPDRIVHLAGQSSVHRSWAAPGDTLRKILGDVRFMTSTIDDPDWIVDIARAITDAALRYYQRLDVALRDFYGGAMEIARAAAGARGGLSGRRDPQRDRW